MSLLDELLKVKDKKNKIAEQIQQSDSEDEINSLSDEIKDLNEQEGNILMKMQQEENGPVNTPLYSPVGGSSKSTFNDCVKIYSFKDKISDQYNKQDSLSMGSYLKGALTGQWNEGSLKERDAFKALTTGTGTVLIPQTLSANIIDLARNKSVLFGRVPTVEMTSNNMTLARITEDPKLGFKGELANSNISDMSFEGITLKSRTVYGLVKLSLEVLNSAQNVDSVVTNAIAASVAQSIDEKFCFGDGALEPKGILTYDTINSVDASATTDYTPFINAVGKIRQANENPTDWVINANTDTALNNLKTTTGEYLQAPKVLENLNRSISNQFPSNGGAGTNESTAMVFDINSVLMGIQKNLTIEVSKETGWLDGSVYVRVYGFMDIALLKPKAITKINKLI